MSPRRLRPRGLSQPSSSSSQARSSSASASSTVTGAAAVGSSSQSQRRSARLESCPTSSQVRRRREREEASGCPPAPHNSVDQSVIVLDDTLQVRIAILSFSGQTSPHHLSFGFPSQAHILSLNFHRKTLWRKSSRLPVSRSVQTVEGEEEVGQSQYSWRIRSQRPRPPADGGHPPHTYQASTPMKTWPLTRTPSTELWD